MALDSKILKYQRLLIKMSLKFGEVVTFRTHKAGRCDCYNQRFGYYDPMCPLCVGTGNPVNQEVEFKDTRALAIVTSPDDERIKEFSGGQMRQWNKAALFAYAPSLEFVKGYLGWLRTQAYFDSRASGRRYNLVWNSSMPQDEVIKLQPGQASFVLQQAGINDISTSSLSPFSAGFVNRPLSETQNSLASGADGTLELDGSDSEKKTIIIDSSVTISEEGLYAFRHWVPYNKISVYKPALPDVWVGYNVKIGEYFYLESMHEIAEKGEHYVVKDRNNVEGGIYEAGYWAGLEVTTQYPNITTPSGPVK